MGTVFNAERTFGFEIEINTRISASQLVAFINTEFTTRGINASIFDAGYTHETHRNWKVVPDGSVDGWEVVSPILKGLDARKELEAVCAGLKNAGCRVSRQTGVHVHHDVADLTPKQIGMAFGTYAAFQTLIDMSVAPSRRGNRTYTNSVPQTVTDYGRDKWDDVTTRTEAIAKLDRTKGSSRYSAMNHCSFNPRTFQYHGTVEFRQMQGSMNATKIWSWMMVTQSIIERTVQGPAKFPKSLTIEMAEGKAHRKGDFNRFKAFIGVLPKRNGYNTVTTRPYCEAFRVFYKSIKRFSLQAGIAPENVSRNR